MHLLRCLTLSIVVLTVCLASSAAKALNGAPSETDSRPAVAWHANYARAMAEAERKNKMLLIYFCDAGDDTPCHRFKAETLDDPKVQGKL
jgi:hypothetical protein